MELCPDRKGKQCVWKCLCECGNLTEVRGASLRFGQTQSCGCRKRLPNKQFSGFGEISGSYWYGLRYNAVVRDLVFDLTMEEAWNLFLQQDRKCALTGIPLRFVRAYRDRKAMQTASLDRKDSNLPYVLSNVQWVHKIVNNMKQDYTEEEFVEWCTLVADHKRKS